MRRPPKHKRSAKDHVNIGDRLYVESSKCVELFQACEALGEKGAWQARLASRVMYESELIKAKAERLKAKAEEMFNRLRIMRNDLWVEIACANSRYSERDQWRIVREECTNGTVCIERTPDKDDGMEGFMEELFESYKRMKNDKKGPSESRPVGHYL